MKERHSHGVWIKLQDEWSHVQSWLNKITSNSAYIYRWTRNFQNTNTQEAENVKAGEESNKGK